MTAVIFQPAGGSDARDHYAQTVAAPVPQELLASYLSTEDMAEIHRIYSREDVPTWGVTQGAREVNRKKWDRMTPGDVVLMSRDDEIFVSLEVTYKVLNQHLAERLWGHDAWGRTWQYLYFAKNVTPQSLPLSVLRELIGYKPPAPIRGFTVLGETQSGALLTALEMEGA